MRILDFHTHIYPEAIAAKATRSICDFYALEGGGMQGTAQQLLAQGKQVGIEKFVVLPVGLNPIHVRHINEFILGQTAQHPEFIGFGTLHAGMDSVEAEADFIIRAGLHGVKLHPDTQRFPIDDPRLFAAYDLMQGRIPLMLHMGDPRYDYSHPLRLRRVLEQFPRLQVIAAHFGGYSMPDVAFEALHDKDCIMDISSSLMFMEPEEAVKRIRAYGAERLVYGSDFPLWNPVEEVKRFQALKLTAREQEQIAWDTAHTVLGSAGL